MINIFLDTSGSMSEMGKDSSAIYIVKSIQDYYKIYKKNVNLYDFEGKCIHNITSINFKGKSNIKMLNNFLIEKDFFFNILITDGLFDENVFFEKSMSITIGIDANQSYLSEITQKVFEPENILQALEYFIYNIQNISNE